MQIKTHMTMINNSTQTRMLQFFCALLHVILGASIRDHHQHLRDVPPHATVGGENLLIDVLQRNAWTKEEDEKEGERAENIRSEEFVFFRTIR